MWKDYFEQTKNRQPSSYLEEGIKLFGPHQGQTLALDMGSGAGRDTRLLAQHNIQVLAIDSDKNAKEYIIDLIENQTVQFVQASFEDFNFGTYHIINASYALPFIRQVDVKEVWGKIRKALMPHGMFVCELFGVNDSWNKNDGQMNFHSREQVQNLLQGMKIHTLEEERKEGKTAAGYTKKWHVFHIIAQNP